MSAVSGVSLLRDAHGQPVQLTELDGSRTTIDLPVPPTANHYYAVVRGRKILSKAGRDYKHAVDLLCRQAKVRPIDGPVIVWLTWRRKQKSGDLDNRIKPSLDSIKGHAYRDDKQVVAIYANRVDGGPPGLTVTVEKVA